MKFNQNAFLTLLSLLLFTGCAFEQLGTQSTGSTTLSGDSLNDDDSDSGEGSQDPQVDPELNFGKHALGTKAFNQVYAGMQALTGISIPTQGPTNFSNIRTQYNTSRASLPSSNSLNSFSPTNILAVFNLAFEFCDVLAANAAIRNSFFSNTIFAASNGSVALVDLNTEERQNAFAEHLLFKFLGNEVSSLDQRDLMKTELLSLIVDLRSPTNISARNLWASVCTSALGGASLNLF